MQIWTFPIVLHLLLENFLENLAHFVGTFKIDLWQHNHGSCRVLHLVSATSNIIPDPVRPKLYDRECQGLEPITALIFILRLPSLQSFRLQTGPNMYSDTRCARFSRDIRTDAALLPAATHMHIIMSPGYTGLIVDLFKASPHITSVILEPYQLSDIRHSFSHTLPFLSRLEIRTRTNTLSAESVLGHLVDMLWARRVNGFSLPRITVDVSVVLRPWEADDLLEDWHDLCRAGMDGSDVVFRD
ncbi:hypothetical protein BDZ89DRAFT_809112 [Hymenopellis radicata]|nr:hypothetical protein BDZ89DRAFT_809112 [Hymenopellis radicata]